MSTTWLQPVSFSRVIEGQQSGIPIFPEKWSRHLFYKEMSDVQEEKVSIYTLQNSTADSTLTSSEKPHTHNPDNLVAEEADFRQSAQNFFIEALANCN